MRKKREIFKKFLVLIYGILAIAFFAQMPFLNAEDHPEHPSELATCLWTDQTERLEANAYLEAVRMSSLPPAWTFDALEGGLCDQNPNLVQDGVISF